MTDRVRLVLLSFLMLFVELALIRWAGSNVLYLSFVTNFVLLGSFLGIGIGFLRASARINLFPYAPLALVGFVAFVLVFRVEITSRDIIFFESESTRGLPIWVMLPIIFLAVAAVMATIGEGVARTFRKFPALEAYRLDITGSLLGVIAFTGLSFVGAPPVAWGFIAGILMLVLIRQGWVVLRLVAVGGLILLLGQETIATQAEWSPYYKIRVATTDAGDHHISVNGLSHQVVMSTERRAVFEPIYFVPYDHLSERAMDEILVIGSGSGGDVAIALDHGASRVDAVEIDPVIHALGVDRNPDRPYQDDRVTSYIDDGRAFLERSDRRYDLILFALPDSLTLVSGQSSLRLESYLFTREALATARDRLTDDGTFVMYNYYRDEWLVERLSDSLREVYGHSPCVDRLGDVRGVAALSIARQDSLDCEFPTPSGATYASVTDDYPFLYLREPGIPLLYVATIALMLLASLGAVRLAGGRLRPMAGYTDLFLMGAAFLLLETKSVVQFALLFGSTWLVNALVFGGVLLAVLAAIEVTRRFRMPSPVILYAALVVSVLIGWAVTPNQLLPLPFGLRLFAAVVVWFTPILLANLVFAQRFRDASRPTAAFGANLLGAMVGGLIEYAALITGYRALALVVAALYIAALLTSRWLSVRSQDVGASPAGESAAVV